MPPPGPDAAARYELTKRQKPTMPEAEWRALGLKAAPTVYQMFHKLDGLCRECKWEVGVKAPYKTRPFVIVSVATAILFIVSYLLL